jgi:hypothetical protein
MRINYIEVLKNNVEIPIIQRDYAQDELMIRQVKSEKTFWIYCLTLFLTN